MTPTPQEGIGSQPITIEPPGNKDDSIVISGLAGLYPKSRYIRDLEEILYNKINPVSADNVRWQQDHPEAPRCSGNIPGANLFDSQFFRVHHRLGTNTDPMGRKVLEQAFEAIYDAGLNPQELSGKRIGVYIGSSLSESEKALFYSCISNTGDGIVGGSKSMMANRISYWLNTKGPSLALDDACCSSTAALELAYRSLRDGVIEGAIVGGCHLCLHPQFSIHYSRISLLNEEGKTRSFDKNASGFANSEAISVLFLQRAKDALRAYAKIVHVKCGFTRLINDKLGPRYNFYRDPDDSTKFLKEFYEEIGIPPSAVEYVEAFGSANFEADASELKAIDNVFCSSREEPLLVGSVMSNIGFTEACSGITAITKVLLGYHRGELAGNLHYDTPRNDVEAIREGRIKILTDNQKFHGKFAAVNSISVNGINAHVLLCDYYKPKDINRYKTGIPRLVTISGRQESSVQRVIDHLRSHPVDPEEIALLHNIHKMRVGGHLARGYVLLDTNEENKTVSVSKNVSVYDDVRRPLWFLYSGMGSQWTGMGTALMKIPTFAKSIERCQRALEPKGVNLIHVITSTDKTIFDDVLNSFIGITGIQIGLTDVLKEVGLFPDNIIGHSMGELTCAYADGCLSAEETILSAYGRGLVSRDTKFIRGAMAAVGLGFKEISKICPPEIQVACHNSAESSTLTGPAEPMKEFIAQLTAKKIFAKEVQCSNIPYHSSYIAEAGSVFYNYLKTVIKNSKQRSERWFSTSIPEERWNEPLAKYSSAEYHTNNLISPVLFEETCKHIPSNAVVVELAPHGLLQAIIRRSLPDTCTNIPLTRRGHSDNAIMVLEAIGKLFMEGFNPNIQALYPKVEFPVSTKTPYLSHLVDWYHEEKWPLMLYSKAARKMAASCKFVISIHDDEHAYLKGHVIRRKVLLPYSYTLVAVWDTLAMILKVPKKSVNVNFENVHFYGQPVLHSQNQIRLYVSLNRGNGYFEVLDDNSKIASGFIYRTEENEIKHPKLVNTQDLHDLVSKDVYKLFYEREYEYGGEFQNIYSVNNALTDAKLIWNNNWVTFIDGMLQLNALRQEHDTISRLTLVKSIKINPHINDVKVETLRDGTKVLPANISDVQDITRCGGIEIKMIKFHNLPLAKENEAIMKALSFVPRFEYSNDIMKTTEVFLQIVNENISNENVNILGITDNNNNEFTSIENIKIILKNENYIPGLTIKYKQVDNNVLMQKCDKLAKDIDLVVVQNLSTDKDMIKALDRIISVETFIINEEHKVNGSSQYQISTHYSVVAATKSCDMALELLRWKPSNFDIQGCTISVQSESDLSALIEARKNLPQNTSLSICSTYPPVSGLINLVKEWRKDNIRNRVHLFMINEDSDIKKNSNNLPVDLAFNVLKNGLWGGEYYCSVTETEGTYTNAMLVSEEKGNIESLEWIPAPKTVMSGISVTVHYAGINIEDIKRASGVTSEKIKDSFRNIGYGTDFSGVTERGERVMGICLNGSVRTKIIAKPDFTWPVPSHWKLEEAATVPLAYLYAFYCLNIRTLRLIKKKYQYSVLVHGGTGALGQAVINVALAYGYRVFATVSNVSKKKFLLRLFPELQDEDIGNSRDTSFADMIFTATKGRGVDAVFSCVKGELKNLSLKCCGSFGITFDTVQIKNVEEYLFGMDFLSDERSYVAVDIESAFLNAECVKKLHTLMSDGISRGYVRPLSRVTYAANEASRAFRLLASSKHRGRVLLRLAHSMPLPHKRLITSLDDGHLIFCDAEPLGLQIADRLVRRGAKKLHLHMTQTSPLVQFKLHSWNQLGVKVDVSTDKLKDDTALHKLLTEAFHPAFLAGVYVAYANTNCTFANTLDLITRKLCPNLKHFLILKNEDNEKEESICVKRYGDGLPATYLNLSQVQNFNGRVSCQDVLEIIEQSLCSHHPIILAQLKPRPQLTLLQQISSFADKPIDDDNNDATLKDLGFGLETIQLISTILSNTYNLSLNDNEISALSIARIKELQNLYTKKELKKTHGLESLLMYAQQDEMLASTETVALPTLPRHSSMRDEEFDASETYLWLIPGIEGLYERFRVLCERLKLPAFVLQPGLDNLQEDSKEQAVRYSKGLLKKINHTKPFYLLGYETGIMVALELAAILEDHGLTGTIYCIGDGPEEIKSYIDEQLQMFSTEEELELGVIRHMFSLMEGGDAAQLELGVRGCGAWAARLHACVRVLLGRVPHSAQYVHAHIEAARARIQAARRCTPAARALRSQIVLLRAKTSNTAPSSLEQYSVKPLIVHQLSTPMAQATLDLRCTAIINKYLSEDILQTFESRNLCDSYLLNDSIFVAEF